MIVKNFSRREIDNKIRITAEVYWEDIERKSEEIYFEVDNRFSDYVSDGVESFFLATLFPALFYGEKSYTLKGEICPTLLLGTKDVLGWFYHWYYQDKREPIKLNIITKKNESTNNEHRHAASFFTGGIDSLQTLIENRNTYDETHPGYIKHGILAYGLDIDDSDKFKIVESATLKFAEKLNLSLITVHTNIYLIYRDDDAKRDYSFWIYQYQGAALVSIAHFLSEKISMINVASTYDLINLAPYGSHPLIDPNFSSYSMKVYHSGLTNSRLEKVRQSIKYFSKTENFRVCNQFQKIDNEVLNCGVCEKCIRTKLELLVLGELEGSSIFPYNDIKPKMIIKQKLRGEYDKSCYFEFLEPLKNIGRSDLVSVIKYIIARYDCRFNKIKLSFIKIDYYYFKGRLNSLFKIY